MAALAYQPSLLDQLEEPRPERPRFTVAATPEAPAPERRTFEDVVVAAWEGLASAHAGTCLVCGGDVRPRYGAGPKPVAGACTDCGTELS